jgi:hypothetical protein
MPVAAHDPPQLPALLPANIKSARLPANYEAAKQALATCVHLDEVKNWNDKAAALASYARQAGDFQLENMARRLRARAYRRMGIMLGEIEDGRHNAPGRPAVKPQGPHVKSGRRGAGEAAGLSRHQIRNAVRVSAVPHDQFERAVESDRPPSIEALAQAGKGTKAHEAIKIAGIDLLDYQASRRAAGTVRALYGFSGEADIRQIERGTLPEDAAETLEHVDGSIAFLKRYAEAPKRVAARGGR